MRFKKAIANGNWSNPATWDKYEIPLEGDIVASNNYTVTIDQNISVDTLTTDVASIINMIPQMTTYTNSLGEVIYSGEYDTYQYLAYKVFDGVSSYWLTPNGIKTGFIGFSFLEETVVGNYSIQGANNSSAFPKDWTFEAWNGTDWIILETVVNYTSSVAYYGNIDNTTPYLKYRVNITANNGNNNYSSIGELYFLEPGSSSVPSVYGGQFIIQGGVDIVCTNPDYGILTNTNVVDSLLFQENGGTVPTSLTAAFIRGGNKTVVKIAGTSPFILNANVSRGASNTGSSIVYVNAPSGTANLTINGNVGLGYSPGAGHYVNALHSDTPVNLVVNGNLTCEESSWGGAVAVTIAEGSNVLINGNITNNQTTITTTTTLFLYSSQANPSTLTVTGDIVGSTNINSSTNNHVVNVSSYAKVYINNIIGSLVSGIPLISTNIYTSVFIGGNIIFGQYGLNPLKYIYRHFIVPNNDSYLEFPNSAGKDLVYPNTPAAREQFVSALVSVDVPEETDVRLGTAYAYSSRVGKLAMPHPNNVTYGVPVDNTFGNAYLSNVDMWNVLTSTLTTPGTIGERLKNVATPQSTGEQLSSFLNDE